MSEETRVSVSDGIDPFAASLALSGASREKADAFLEDQRHHVREQLKQIHLDIAEKWLGVLLRLATLAVGLAVAVGLTIAVWDASRADGMVVDAFSVPPQLAQAGVTGEVVAGDLTSMIGTIKDLAVSNSLSSSREVHQDSADNVKLEIPETGVSLGEAWRYLRLWLGHERHLSGNLRLAQNGNATLTVMLDGAQVASVSGAAADLGKLEQQAAEQVFAQLDPKNMVLYLHASGRLSETLVAADRAARLAASPIDRADAYSLWSDMIRTVTGDIGQAAVHARIAVALYPKLQVVQWEMMWQGILLGHDEAALHHAQLLPGFKEQDQPPPLQGRGFAEVIGEGSFVRDVLTGDFAQAATEDDCQVCSRSLRLLTRAENAARAHDMAASRAWAEESAASGQGETADWRSVLGADIARVRYYWNANAGDWPAAAASARAYETDLRNNPTLSPGMHAAMLRISAQPLLAIALAKSGDARGAETAIAATAPDCYDCIRARAIIAAEAKQWAHADYWFARATAAAPSLPFAEAEWGQSLLARGAPDAAIAKFTLANRKGPHFADALEGWGEALMAKSQSHLALAKFADANKYAPNWGRLHLKWGEALYYAGKRDDAKAEFSRAAGLDLTPSEKAELAGMSHG